MQIEAKKLLTWTQAVPTAQRSLLLLWWSLLTLGLTYFGVKHIEGGTVLGLFGWPFGGIINLIPTVVGGRLLLAGGAPLLAVTTSDQHDLVIILFLHIVPPPPHLPLPQAAAPQLAYSPYSLASKRPS